MANTNDDVCISRAYSIFFWINAILVTMIASVLSAGIGILLFPLFVWYKLAVLNRTKIEYLTGDNKLTFFTGRWFVRDDDVVPLKAIDNVKLNRSLPGKIFGWADIIIETRSENYRINCVATKTAQSFRDRFLASI